MDYSSKEKIEALRDSGRINPRIAERLLASLEYREERRGNSQRFQSATTRATGAVAIAVASGPGAKAEACSQGGVVEAIAQPGESVYASDIKGQ